MVVMKLVGYVAPVAPRGCTLCVMACPIVAPSCVVNASPTLKKVLMWFGSTQTLCNADSREVLLHSSYGKRQSNNFRVFLAALDQEAIYMGREMGDRFFDAFGAPHPP